MRVAELACNPKLEGVAVAHLADHEEPPVRRGMRTISYQGPGLDRRANDARNQESDWFNYG
jgi:hypothetical protein